VTVAQPDGDAQIGFEHYVQDTHPIYSNAVKTSQLDPFRADIKVAHKKCEGGLR